MDKKVKRQKRTPWVGVMRREGFLWSFLVGCSCGPDVQKADRNEGLEMITTCAPEMHSKEKTETRIGLRLQKTLRP